MTNYDYLIIGGGMSAAAWVDGIREVDPTGGIGMISTEPDAPYNRPPLSKALWKGQAPGQHLAQDGGQRGGDALGSRGQTDCSQRKRRVWKTATGREIAVDGVVAGIGLEPNIELAQSAGLKTADGIIVDEFLRTQDPNIYAAGGPCALSSLSAIVTLSRSQSNFERLRADKDQCLRRIPCR